jgi:hypothetical protein
MGAVYEAIQLRLNKRVAIKVMASEVMVSPWHPWLRHDRPSRECEVLK